MKHRIVAQVGNDILEQSLDLTFKLQPGETLQLTDPSGQHAYLFNALSNPIYNVANLEWIVQGELVQLDTSTPHHTTSQLRESHIPDAVRAGFTHRQP